MLATYRDKKENLAVMTDLMEGARFVLSEHPLEVFEPIQLKGTVDQVLKMKVLPVMKQHKENLM